MDKPAKEQLDVYRLLLHNSQKEQFPYEISVFGLTVRVYRGVFSPKYFNGWKIFTKNFPFFENEDILEIGCGTGVTSLYLAKNGARSVVATDINFEAVENARENVRLNDLGNIDIRHSDIFSNVKEGERFDTIYWNMPFIRAPQEYRYESQLERSLFDPGYILAGTFLAHAKKHLKPCGRILIGTGDLGDIPALEGIAQNHNYSMKLRAKEESSGTNPVVFKLYELQDMLLNSQL